MKTNLAILARTAGFGAFYALGVVCAWIIRRLP